MFSSLIPDIGAEEGPKLHNLSHENEAECDKK